MQKIVGGNRVDQWDLNSKSQLIFESSPYLYRRLLIDGDKIIGSHEFGSFTLYVFSTSDGQPLTAVVGEKDEITIASGEVLQVEGLSVKLQGRGVVLISGVKVGTRPTQWRHQKSNEIRKVSKHWGHELWLNGEHPDYAFKQIYLKAGTKTSLQYHRLKSETNILFEGKARLYFKSNSEVSNDTVQPTDLGSCELEAGMSVSVQPNTLHRIEAITDVTLYEVSTPHLDDVVRIADDQNRPDGRIEDEHRARA